jgi:hypothetical protein
MKPSNFFSNVVHRLSAGSSTSGAVRDEMVREHYKKLGFTLVSEATDGSTRWQLRTDVELGELPMTVERDYPHLEPA